MSHSPPPHPVIQLVVPPEAAGQRLDRYLAAALQERGFSRERIKQGIKNGDLLLDGAPCRKPNTLLGGGEALTLNLPATPSLLVPEAGALDILHEDNDLVVLAKPAGLTVHPAPGLTQGTLVHRLLHRYPELVAQIDPEASGSEDTEAVASDDWGPTGMHPLRPGIVHRLDKETSGLILIARNERTRLALSRAFAERQVEKHYLALVQGVPRPASGSITEPLGRHPVYKTRMAVLAKGGRPARSDYTVLHAAPDRAWSLLGVRIHTGRTHQIRVHLQHLGHPILGDAVYGPRTPVQAPCPPKVLARLAPRQLLHAWRLALEHPWSGEALSFRLPPPGDFLRTALCLSRRVQRLVVTGLPGCGKSALGKLLAEAGVPVFSADAAVSALYAPGGEGRNFLMQRYGERFLLEDKNRSVDKKALFIAMRQDEHLRREVEGAVHPLVRHELDAFWQEHAGQRLAVAEIPLLLEAGAAWRREAADLVVGVWRPRSLRLQSLAQSRGWDAETLAALEAWQWPEAAKLRACDLLVDNSGDLADLERRTRSLLAVLRHLRAERMHKLARTLEGLWGAER